MVRRDAMVSQTEPLVLAADIGGTHMRAALVEHNGTIFVHRTAPTPAHDDAPAALVDLIRSVIDMSGPADSRSRGRWASRRPSTTTWGMLALGTPPPGKLDDGPHERRS